MRTVKKSEDEQMNSLLDITYTISKVYDDLIKYTIENNCKKYQEYLECLLLCQELEDQTYQNMGVSLENYDRVSTKIERMNHQRNEELERKNRVITRINNYLLKKHYLNPFLSMQKDTNLCREENMIAITNQYDRDYIFVLLYLLSQRIEEEKDQLLKKEFIEFKYEVLMMNKSFENDYLFHQNQDRPAIDGRKIALLFGQDEWEILDLYSEKTMIMLNFNIYQIMNLSEEQLLTLKSKQAFYQEQLISLESILALLEKEEQEVVYQSFVNTFLPTFQELGDQRKIQDICHVFDKEFFLKEKVKIMKTCD